MNLWKSSVHLPGNETMLRMCINVLIINKVFEVELPSHHRISTALFHSFHISDRFFNFILNFRGTSDKKAISHVSFVIVDIITSFLTIVLRICRIYAVEMLHCTVKSLDCMDTILVTVTVISETSLLINLRNY